jgi:hypothetical protein
MPFVSFNWEKADAYKWTGVTVAVFQKKNCAVFEMPVEVCLTFHDFERLSKGRFLWLLKCNSSTERQVTLQWDNNPIVLVPLHVRERQDNREGNIFEIMCRHCMSKSLFFFRPSCFEHEICYVQNYKHFFLVVAMHKCTVFTCVQLTGTDKRSRTSFSSTGLSGHCLGVYFETTMTLPSKWISVSPPRPYKINFPLVV